MDQPTTPAPAMPPLMSAERAHDIGRLYQALAEQFEAGSGNAQAARELQKAHAYRQQRGMSKRGGLVGREHAAI